MADLPSDAGTVSFTYPFLKDVDPLRPPSSIVIPVKYLSAMTNMERQYWEIKSKLYNVVIFFKKGKFYEVYDYDAVIANREFGLKMVFDCSNRGKMRLAGVPEQSFSEWARLFVFRGYKVGRVEQMKEDPDGENITGAKIVPRELVEVLTPGTLTDLSMLADHHEVFILAVAVVDDTIDAFAVDLSRKVFLKCPCRLNAEFHSRQPGNPDGGSLSALTALLQRLHPKEVIMPLDASEASEKVLKWIETEGFCVERVAATNCAEYADATPAQMLLSSYFCSMRLERYTPLFSEATLYQFHLAPPPGTTPESSTKGSLLSWERKWDQGLVVDSNTVNNLEIVANSRDGLESFSLNHCLNNCISNGGKRLFRSWLLRPSSEYSVILGRQDAVQFLRKHQLYGNWMNEAGSSNSTPLSQKRGRVSGRGPESAYANLDFERYLSRLSDIKSESQQIAYVDPLVQYKKNLGIILSTVDAFEKMVCWAKSFHEQCASFCETLPPLLVELISGIELADKAVQEMRSLFDPNAVTESGLLIPVQGACPMYDKASIVLSSLESKLDAERIRMSTEVFGGVGISFSDLGKDLFLVEVPTVSAPAATPRGMIERTRTSKSVRYVVEAISSLVDEHKSATATKSAALLGVLREIATCFCKHSPALFNATWCFSYLDCLMNLCGMCDRHPLMCLPKIVPPEDKKVCCEGSFIMARNIIHPVMVTCTSTSPVPNSVELSTAMGRVLVLTGPNMAGKSTLMRTIAINALLAQLGGPVFAAEYSMRPLDRIFTRIGARDATTKGQSTLFVELIETAEILRFASSNSLCLIDELGRGTSTHDGLAIAYATLDSLIKRQCPPLTLFSTHYHSLALEQERRRKRDAESASSPNHGVQLGYMDFALSQQHELTSAPSTSVTFLYRFVHGVCDRSYGVEVALLAGIRPELVHLASKKSAELSRQSAFHEDAHVLAEFMNGGIDFKMP